jgi:phage terminase large subunit-like protein
VVVPTSRSAGGATAGSATASGKPIRHVYAPFTIEHFSRWTRRIVLDTGKHWSLEDFQGAFVADLFGGRPENWLVLPEGNAKTTLVAGLAIYHIEHLNEGKVQIAASSRDQGEIMYSQADGMIERSELLGFKRLEGYRRIRYDARRSRIQIFAADDSTGDGVIGTLSILEELHRHRSLALYRTWRGKVDKRRRGRAATIEGQVLAISTRGEPRSEFEAAIEKIIKESPEVTTAGSFTRAASRSLVFHGWGLPEGSDVHDLPLVKTANPLKAITVKSLRDKHEGPTMTEAHWRRFTCGLPTRGEMSAVSENEWAGAKVDDLIPEGEPIWLGLDVAWKWDTTSAVPFWLRDPKFRQFGPALVLVPPRDGSMLDIELVKRGLRVIHDRNPIHTVVMDMSLAADLAQWIEDELGAEVIDRSKSNNAAVEDYDRFMEALRNGWLHHVGDQGLTRHVMNAVARQLPGGDIRFDRRSTTRQGGDQESRVVDALDAAAMVHTEATRSAEPDDDMSAYVEDPYRILI